MQFFKHIGLWVFFVCHRLQGDMTDGVIHCMQGERPRKSGAGLGVVRILYYRDMTFSIGIWAEDGSKRHFHIPCSPNFGKANGDSGAGNQLWIVVNDENLDFNNDSIWRQENGSRFSGCLEEAGEGTLLLRNEWELGQGRQAGPVGVLAACHAWHIWRTTPSIPLISKEPSELCT